MDRALNMSLDDIIRNRSSGRCRVRGAGPEGRVVRGSFGSGRIGRMGDLRQRNLGVSSRPSAASIAMARLFLVIKYLRNQFKEERLESMGIRVAFYTLMKGSTEVVYARRSDAFAALKRYNNVQLDGWPMKIEILSPNSEAPLTTLPVLTLS
ncbi:THO complex subunit 4B-like protein [Drosera capensis]